MKLCVSSLNSDATFDSMTDSIYHSICQNDFIINCWKKQSIFIWAHLCWSNCIKCSPFQSQEKVMQRNSCILFSTFYNLECAGQPSVFFLKQIPYILHPAMMVWTLRLVRVHCHFTVISRLFYIFFFNLRSQDPIHISFKTETKGNIVSEENKVHGKEVGWESRSLDLVCHLLLAAKVALSKPPYLSVLLSYSTPNENWGTVVISFIFSTLLSVREPKSYLLAL